MPRITIDGLHLDAADGTTVLDAARALGIDIPTLCHVPELDPLTTCFVCVVQVAGQPRMLPACATVVADGMVVVSDSPEVRAARKAAVELLLSDHLGECEAPCQISCPAGLRIPTFMDDLADGQTASAARLARDDLVLPSVLGMICPRFCESNCRRQERDQPVAIADLHRYTGLRDIRRPPEPTSELITRRSGRKVGIVGAGPTGLAAAAVLLRQGHAVTLFDRSAEPGGMLRNSLDEARLPKAVLAGEIAAVRRLGAEFRMGVGLGRDITLEQLRRDFDAVLLAVGAPTWQPLDCAGGELAEPAGELMARVAAGEDIAVEGDVMVVGAAQEAVEVARTAARRGADSVTLLCPRPEAHLPLLARQLAAARADGIAIHFGVKIHDVRRPAGRIYVNAAGGDKRVLRIDGNRLLIATGRDVELDMLAGQGLAVGKRGIAVDRATLATSLPGVFAGGDAVSGGGFCVRAIAYGKAAAVSIDQLLRGRPVAGPVHPHTVRYGKLPDEERALLQAMARNTGPRAPDVPTSDDAARAEAARCLICGCQDSELPPDFPHLIERSAASAGPPLSLAGRGAGGEGVAQTPSADRPDPARRCAKHCRLRQVATLLDADSARYKGERRAMERDASHRLVVYESHKCVMCGACVAIVEAARAAGELDGAGLTYVGRGFNVRVAVPWGGKLADAFGELARRCAAACPTSAIVLKPRPPGLLP